MYVAIDKVTAVRMYDKVRKYCSAYLAEQEKRLANAVQEETPALKSNLDWLKATDMAVVVSQSQNEIADMKAKGLDIKPHRERLVKEDMDEKFKDPNDPLRLVFVCAMWITGFDLPTCSTKRASREGLSEEELAVFDLLTRPTPKLTKAQEIEAKRVAKSLLATLTQDRLVQNWRLKAQTRAAVRTTIREVLNELPDEPYPKDLWDQKVDLTYLYVFEHFPGPGSGGAGATMH